MTAYYNEHDRYASDWLGNLVAAGLVSAGKVDARDIQEVVADDVRGFNRAHFFAGIGVWDHALRCAGWPTELPVWTGSCPCQPFSGAGARKGTSDERHLWPEWFRLIRECRPPVILGEQVASKDALGWLDIVFADLESQGYACGAADLCAASVGAPHIRQRLLFVAYDAEQGRLARRGLGEEGGGRDAARVEPGRLRAAGSGTLAYPGGERRQQISRSPLGDEEADGRAGWVRREQDIDYVAPGVGATGGFWYPADWLPCIDGKARPVEPGTFPLAHGAPGRVGRLRAYGNAIVAPLAQAWVETVMEELGHAGL